MTDIKQLQLEKEEIAIRLNELGAIEKQTPEQTTEMGELQKRGIEVGKRYKALLVAEGLRSDNANDPDKKFAAEIRLRDFLPALKSGGKVEDRAREFAEEKKINLHPDSGDGVRVPWEALVPRGREPEKRAVVAGPEGGTMYEDILYRIFKESPLGFLGVRMLNVNSGSVGVPVFATGATAEVKGTDQATATAQDSTFSVHTLEPDSRVTANYVMDLGDVIRVPDLESSLAGDLTMGISDKMVDLVINGDGSELVSGENQPTGFLSSYTVTAETTTDTFATYVTKLAAQVDGLYAYSPSDIRALVSPNALNKMVSLLAKQYSADPGSSESVYQHLMQVLGSGMLKASAFLPVAANVGSSIVRLGTRMDCSTMAVFGGGLDLVRDIYSGAKKGQVSLTALVYMDFVITRSAGYKEVSIKTA